MLLQALLYIFSAVLLRVYRAGAHQALVYRARPISLAYWKLELGHREKREGLADVISIHSFVIIIVRSSQL